MQLICFDFCLAAGWRHARKPLATAISTETHCPAEINRAGKRPPCFFLRLIVRSLNMCMTVVQLAASQ